jgi:hypothetical protein
MKFSLVFENTGDSIPFEVVYNHELFEFFVEKSVSNNQNIFSDQQKVAERVGKSLINLHWALSNTNEVMYDLVKINFPQSDNLETYLDQSLLNRIHAEWVFSQNHKVQVHQLRFSQNINSAKLGERLHDQFPDEIVEAKLAVVMQYIGRIYPYEEVNMAVHRLESIFTNNIEFNADGKWKVFDNPFQKTSMISNLDRMNFTFGYTYVGRQLYNKFEYFDMNLDCEDHYNYETLEYSFNVNLQQPETVVFSPEFLTWCKRHNRQPMANQIPIANAINLDKHLTKYRKILYNNSQASNSASIILH